MGSSDDSDVGSVHEDQSDIVMEDNNVEDEEEYNQQSDENMEEQEQEEEEEYVDSNKVEIVSSAQNDPTSMTFCFRDEDHTVGNSLRHMINKNPQVDFCGYSIPHPTEPKMHVRIQTSEKTTAVDAVLKGLNDLSELCTHIRDTYEAELAKKKYTVFKEIA